MKKNEDLASLVMPPSVPHLGPLPLTVLCYSGNLPPLGSFLLNSWHLTEPKSNPQTDKQKQLIRTRKRNHRNLAFGPCPMAVSYLGSDFALIVG